MQNEAALTNLTLTIDRIERLRELPISDEEGLLVDNAYNSLLLLEAKWGVDYFTNE